MKNLTICLASVVFSAQVYAATTTSASTASMVTPMAPSNALTVSAAKAGAKPKKVTVSFLSENAAPAAKANRSNWTGSVTSQNHVGVAYDLGKDRTIQFRQYYLYNMTDGSNPNEHDLGDHVVQYTDKKSAKVADADVLTAVRLYLPGTENNRKVGKYELRVAPAITQQVTGKLAVEYGLGMRLYAYSSDDNAQRGARVLPAVEATYEVNKVLSPFIGAYTDTSWYHTGKGLSLSKGTYGYNPGSTTNSLYTDIGTSVNIAQGAAVKLYVETERDTTKDADYNPFIDKNNSYNLELSMSY